MQRDLGTVDLPAPLTLRNVVTTDQALVDALEIWADEPIADQLSDLGAVGASGEARDHARLANAHPPVLRLVDPYGRRMDEVEYHPSWHWLMQHATGFGLHASPWVEGVPHAHLRRAAGFYAWSQVEAGHGCSISMTYAAVPALQTEPTVAEQWTPLLASRLYDPHLVEPGAKSGALAGMAFVERQGGSDYETYTTRATPLDTDGDYLLNGHKWFCSAPMNDVFLVLAQAPGGLTCFLVPRVLDDGTRNTFALQRLKDKLGNRSNASAEIELDDTFGQRLGDEGAGVATIAEMVSATRLDCILGSAALMRRATAEAISYCSQRKAFGRPLVDQPLMTNVLADLALESEAAMVVGMRLADCVDHPDDEREQALRRIGLPLAKFWVCKRAKSTVLEAAECLGGLGYVEDSGVPTLVREAPFYSIWEGSGNGNALEALRVLRSEPGSLDAWLDVVVPVRGAHPALDATLEETLGMLGDLESAEPIARRLAASMATCLQAALLFSVDSETVAEEFCASRLSVQGAPGLGQLVSGQPELRAIVNRALPTLD